MRKTFWIPILLGLTAYLALPLPGQSAPLQQRIAKTRQQIEGKKSKEGVLTTQITAYSLRVNSLQGDISQLAKRQATIERSLNAQRAELLSIRGRLTAARDRLARLRGRLLEAQQTLAARLVEIYKADQPDILTVILEADGFDDLLTRTEFLDRIGRQDRRIITAVRDLKVEVTKQANQLAELDRRQAIVVAGIQAKRDDVASSKARLESRQSDLAAASGARRQALRSIRQDRHGLEGNLSKMIAQENAIRARLSGAGPVGPIRRGSGNFIWPVNGPIVSGFGMRWGRLHAGVDIAVPTGTPIRAAGAGTVVLMAPTSGYGNYTCVAHGGGISTCYAHQSRFGTSSGAHVSQGQVIGYVGCTGHCLGPHLHFEVRVNGVPVNPLGYL
jgi:murein DD-endopeptidase MepM/ murein hydrolase activator NlpD